MDQKINKVSNSSKKSVILGGVAVGFLLVALAFVSIVYDLDSIYLFGIVISGSIGAFHDYVSNMKIKKFISDSANTEQDLKSLIDNNLMLSRYSGVAIFATFTIGMLLLGSIFSFFNL